MNESNKEYRELFKTDTSSIVLNDRSLTVRRYGAKLGKSPVGIVSILPGVQLELGRTITEFITCLREVRKPIGFHKIASTREESIWDVIRISTGCAPEAIVCRITTVNDIMVSVWFNKSLVTNTNYTKYQPLSGMHQLTAGLESVPGLLSRALDSVSTVTGDSTDKFLIKSDSKRIIVYTNTPGEALQYKYTFTKGKDKFFNLLSVSIMAKKS